MTVSKTSKLFTPNPRKYTVFTGHAPKRIVELCDLQEANIWLASDLNLTYDDTDWEKLNDDEQKFIKETLAFFAGADGIVNENISTNFVDEVEVPEVRYFYYFQNMMEAVHSKVYSQLINTFIDSKEEREDLFDAIHNHPIIKKKAEWCFKWMNEDVNFSERMLAFLAVEGIFFAGSFASIFWLRNRGILANTLGAANEYIMRDENLHAEFAIAVYQEYLNDVSEDRIKEILLSALDLEKEFIAHALPNKLFGMNQDLMNQHLEFVTDRWLEDLNIAPHFNVEEPFAWMSTIGQQRKDNFFEKNRTNYARQTVSKQLDFSAISF